MSVALLLKGGPGSGPKKKGLYERAKTGIDQMLDWIGHHGTKMTGSETDEKLQEMNVIAQFLSRQGSVEKAMNATQAALEILHQHLSKGGPGSGPRKKGEGEGGLVSEHPYTSEGTRTAASQYTAQLKADITAAVSKVADALGITGMSAAVSSMADDMVSGIMEFGKSVTSLELAHAVNDLCKANAHESKIRQAASLIDSEYPNKKESSGHQKKMQGIASQIKGEYTEKACKACKAGNCAEHMGKAMTSRALSIPVYMRPGIHDQDGIRRSATMQTSRMYTALSPDADNTIAHVATENDVRTKQAVVDLKRSQAVQQQRLDAMQIVPRTSLWTHL